MAIYLSTVQTDAQTNEIREKHTLIFVQPEAVHIEFENVQWKLMPRKTLTSYKFEEQPTL